MDRETGRRPWKINRVSITSQGSSGNGRNKALLLLLLSLMAFQWRRTMALSMGQHTHTAGRQQILAHHRLCCSCVYSNRIVCLSDTGQHGPETIQQQQQHIIVWNSRPVLDIGTINRIYRARAAG